jgi:hypothetical protein
MSLSPIILYRLSLFTGSWLNHAENGADGNQLYANDAKRFPGIFAFAEIYGIETYVSRELFGDGNAYTFGFEIKVRQLYSAGEKLKTAKSRHSLSRGSASSTQSTTPCE